MTEKRGATQSYFARHMDVTQPVVSQWKERGLLVESEDGRIDVDASRRSVLANLRGQAAGRIGASGDDLDLTAERARKAKEEADKLEMLNAQLRGDLLARDDVDAAVVGAFARVRARMIGVPSKVAPIVAALDNPAEIEGVVRKAVYEALRELSETNVTDLGGDYGDVVEDAGTASGSDGEPVGRREAETER